MDKKIDSRMLDSIKAIEGRLAVKGIKRILEKIPEGHPLKDTINAEDLSGLVEIRTEQEEVAQSSSNQKPISSSSILASDQKLKQWQATEARLKEEQVFNECRIAAQKINSFIEASLDILKQLYLALAENERFFDNIPHGRSHVLRFKRFLCAAERGLEENRFKRM